MNTGLTFQTNSTSSDFTEKLAAKIGKNLKGGEVVELISDLGGGKTVFAKGLATGAGSQDLVSSPTFTISKVYKCPKFEIHHFDFYRLSDPGVVKLELKEVIHDKKIVTVVEWANIVGKVLPQKHIKVDIKSSDENSRKIKITVPKSYSYLLEGVKK
jgi:tRNA threonylcarbamoyladenosine biosynthesis protein TsaE